MFRTFRWHALCLPVLPFLAIFLFTTQAAYGAWIEFSITSVNPGQSAIGFEQIFEVPGTGARGNGLTGPGFDYAYLVLNTGRDPIDGFFFDVGVLNTRAGVATFVANSPRGQDTFTASGGRDDGVFPNVFPGGRRPTQDINGELGPLNPYFFDSAPVNPLNGPGVNPLPPGQGRLQQWGFEQFWNPAMTAYLARWYANTPSNGLGALPSGFITRFDVFSPFGPVPGGGGVDPLDTGNYIGLDDGSGDFSNLILSPAVTPCNPAVLNSCASGLPPGLTETGFGPVGRANNVIPEPASMILLLLGLASFGFSIQRRSRR